MCLFHVIFRVNIIPGSDVRSCSIKQQVKLIIGSFEIDDDLDDLGVILLGVALWDGVDEVEHLHADGVLDCGGLELGLEVLFA